MASYRLIMFGLSMGAVGVTLIFFNVFVTDVLNISAGIATSPEASASRDYFQWTSDGLAWVCLVLGALSVIAGALEDRAMNIRP